MPNKPRFKKRVSRQVPSKFQKASGYWVSNPNLKKGKGTNSRTEKPTWEKWGKKHYGDCLKGMDNCFVVVKVGRKL